MENSRNRINFKLCSSKKQVLGIKSTRLSYTMFNENLVGAHLAKGQVKLNKPIYIG